MTDRTIVVSHHEGGKGALLRECLVPLALRLRDSYGAPGGDGADDFAAPCYLERHWLRGPHVRLAVPTSMPDAAVASAIGEIEAYLAAHPSLSDLVEADYVRLSEELGRAELVRPPYAPLRADHSVSVEDTTSATTALLSAPAFRLKELYLTEAVRPLGLALDAVAGGLPRAVPAFQALVASAARWPVGGIRSGQLSYRSHLEDYLANNDATGAVRARLESELARTKDKFRVLFASVLDDTGADGVYHGADPYLRAWSHVFDVVWPPALAAAERRDFEEDHGPGYLEQARTFDAATERQWRFEQDRPSSEFHHRLARLNYLPDRIHVVPFAAYRFLTNTLTRWLPLLDVPPIERYFLSLAVSELTEERFGVTWQEQFGRIIDEGGRVAGGAA